MRVSLSEHEYLAGRFLLSELKVSIRLRDLGAASKLKSEPHVLESFGTSFSAHGL